MEADGEAFEFRGNHLPSGKYQLLKYLGAAVLNMSSTIEAAAASAVFCSLYGKQAMRQIIAIHIHNLSIDMQKN